MNIDMNIDLNIDMNSVRLLMLIPLGGKESEVSLLSNSGLGDSFNVGEGALTCSCKSKSFSQSASRSTSLSRLLSAKALRIAAVKGFAARNSLSYRYSSTNFLRDPYPPPPPSPLV